MQIYNVVVVFIIKYLYIILLYIMEYIFKLVQIIL